MKAIFQRFQSLILIGIFGFIGVTPVYASFRLPFFRSVDDNKHEVRQQTPSPENRMRNEFREEEREKTGTPPGFLEKVFRSKKASITGNVTAVDGTTITLQKDGKSYTVETNNKTQFRRRFWGKGSLEEIQVGDLVNVIGKWTDDTQSTVLARLVRNLSVQKFMGVFFGTVQSLNENGWVMKTLGRGDQTVVVTETTKYVNRKEETIAQTDITVGHRVRVKGLWDRKVGTITDVTAVKDFSLPPVVTVTPSPVSVAATSTPTPTVIPTDTPVPTP